MGHAPLFLCHLHLFEQLRMIAFFHPEERVTAVLMQRFDVRRIGTEPIFGDHEPQMRVIVAQCGDEAFGGMARTIIFRAPIVFDDRFRPQRNHVTPIRMNERGPQQLMRRGDRPVTVVLFET